MTNAELLMKQFGHLTYTFDKNMPDKLKGLCIDDSILLNPRQSEQELYCTVSEEIAHYYTSVGDITDYNHPESRKQERKARLIASEITIHPEHLIACKKEGLTTYWECAEYLGVSDKALKDAIQLYKDKYGLGFIYNNYAFMFENCDTLDIREI